MDYKEKWKGVVKCILFIVDVYYVELSMIDQNETLRFFSELKADPQKAERLYHVNFKDFIKNLIFDDQMFDALEIKFKTIKENLMN